MWESSAPENFPSLLSRAGSQQLEAPCFDKNVRQWMDPVHRGTTRNWLVKTNDSTGFHSQTAQRNIHFQSGWFQFAGYCLRPSDHTGLRTMGSSASPWHLPLEYQPTTSQADMAKFLISQVPQDLLWDDLGEVYGCNSFVTLRETSLGRSNDHPLWIQSYPLRRYKLPPNCTLSAFRAADPWIHRDHQNTMFSLLARFQTTIGPCHVWCSLRRDEL